MFITTESVAVEPPLVQLSVKVVGLPTEGYQGCGAEIGPPVPESEIPETPVGLVRVQAVASFEVQE